MNKFLAAAFSVLIFSSSFSQSKQAAKMFRGNAAHDSYVSSGNDLVYDTRAWQFNAGSPVRATPLVDNNTVYFGNAKGDFFALDKKTSQVRWKYNTGKAIHSSAASQDGKVYFADNGQTVYCLRESNGQLLWKFAMGKKQEYLWRYDYYYSSPVLYGDKLFIGGDDGFFYALDLVTGKPAWKFKCKGIVRSTGAIYKNAVLFGDTEASFYSVDTKSGKELWQYKINGDTMRNEDWGFDRRAITSSAVIAGNKVIVGGRDGFLYCLNGDTGKDIWKLDYYITWVISTAAIKDSIIATATSDGRYVNAINLETGKELWKSGTPLAVWSSPLIVNDKVYTGSFDGQLACMDLKTGKKISRFKANGKILSSAVWDDGMLYVGSDDGNLYALSGHADNRQYKDNTNKYVYYQEGINVYFRNNSDLVIKNYLRSSGYKLIGPDSISYLMSQSTGQLPVIVFATCYFPPAITVNGKNSIIRQFLDRGGKIVLAGTNPLVYIYDDSGKTPVGFRPYATDTLFNLNYGAGDTRTFKGDLTSFPTQAGKQLGLPDYWTSSLFIDEKNVDVVLGRNENGDVSAYIKKFSNGGQLVQIWMDADRPDRMDAIIRAAEWKLE